MKYLFYHYNSQGTLIFDYSDEYGRHIEHAYLFYSLRDAIKKFREDNGLKHKHIHIEKLY